MGKEFEAKVLLTADEYINILEKQVQLTICLASGSYKSDVYYSKYASTEEAIKNNESLVRIRQEDGKAFLTLKQKAISNGFENNSEYETLVSDISVVQKLLLEAGYSPYFKKYKLSHAILPDTKPSLPGVEVHIELETVENSKHPEKSTYKRFYALEIEVVATDNNISIPDEDLATLVKSYFSAFNKTEADFETRSWRELLS